MEEYDSKNINKQKIKNDSNYNSVNYSSSNKEKYASNSSNKNEDIKDDKNDENIKKERKKIINNDIPIYLVIKNDKWVRAYINIEHYEI